MMSASRLKSTTIPAVITSQAWTVLTSGVSGPVQTAEQELAHALPAVDDLRDDGAADDRGEVERDHRRERDQRVTERMSDEHATPRHSLGAREADVVAVEDVEERRSLVPAPCRVRDEDEREHRQDRVLGVVEESRAEASREARGAVADRVDDRVADRVVDLDRDEVLEQDAQDEDGRRVEDVGEGRREVVVELVLTDGAEDAERDRDHRGDERRRQHHLHRHARAAARAGARPTGRCCSCRSRLGRSG